MQKGQALRTIRNLYVKKQNPHLKARTGGDPSHEALHFRQARDVHRQGKRAHQVGFRFQLPGQRLPQTTAFPSFVIYGGALEHHQ